MSGSVLGPGYRGKQTGKAPAGVTFPAPFGSPKMIDTMQANAFSGAQPWSFFFSQ